MTITKWVGSTQPPTTSRNNYFQHPIGVLDFQHPKTIEVTGEKFSACGCKDTKHWNTSALCEMDKFEAWEAVLGWCFQKICGVCLVVKGGQNKTNVCILYIYIYHYIIYEHVL